MITRRGQALIASDWSMVYSSFSEEYKAKCPESDYMERANYLDSIESISGSEFVFEGVEVEENGAWFRAHLSKDGVRTSEYFGRFPGGEEVPPHAVWEDGRWIIQVNPETLSLEEPCALPERIPYDDLLRYSERLQERTVHYRGEILQVVAREDSSGITVLLVFITEPTTSTQNQGNVTVNVTSSWSDPVRVIYQGPRFLEGDIIEFAGPLLELHTYTTSADVQKTVPQVVGGRIRLIAKAGEPLPESESPSSGPGFTLENPVPVGGILEGSNGMDLEIVDFLADADRVIANENQFNSPPDPGKRYMLIRLNVSYNGTGGSAETNRFDFFLIGERRVVYDTCFAVIHDGLEGELFPGGSVQGNLCFEVPVGEGDLILIHQPGYAESRRFLSIE